MKSIIGEEFEGREVILKWILICTVTDSVGRNLIGQSE
jgi:hypothetical protein